MKDSNSNTGEASSIDLQIADLIQDWLQRRESGSDAVSAEDLIAQHPQFAPHLQQCLDGLLRIERGKIGISLCETTSDQSPGDQSPGDRESLSHNFPQIPDFEILGELGRGGMGVVYRARQISLDRMVALKILPTGSVDPAATDRFTREAETAATLHHTNIVPIHSVGHHNGLHWYAMQLIDGQSVSQWASNQDSRGNEVIDEAVRIGIAAAEALQHAHERGVIHRDVKPGNLLLDQDDQVWLTDFGLARRNSDVTATATGAMLGTPRYMSAEQISASDDSVDHRTDIYSLGATLYELITGQPVFDAPSPLQLLSRIQRDEPSSPRVHNSRVPRELELVLLKSLDKDPGRRYQTAEAMASDLRAIRDHQPISAKGLPLWLRASRWHRRHRERNGWMVTATLATVATFLALFGIWHQYRASQRGRLQIATDGRLHFASIKPLGASENSQSPLRLTAPNQQPLDLAKGAYRLRMDSDGRFSESAIAQVHASEVNQILYVDRREPPPTIEISRRLPIATADGGLAVLDEEKLDVYDAGAELRFSIPCDELVPDHWNQDPEAARHHAAPKLTYGFSHENPFEGDHNVLRSAFARAPRVVPEWVDFDGDGQNDLLVTGRGFAALTAISHGGEVLWKQLLDLPVDPKLRKQTHYISKCFQSAIVGVVAVDDLDDDSVQDLLISAVWFHADGSVQNFLVTLSGSSGSQLAVHDFPVVNMNQTRQWPFVGILKHRSGFGSDRRDHRYLMGNGPEDQRRSTAHSMHGLEWTGTGVGGGIYTLGVPLVAPLANAPVAVVATSKELHYIDIQSAGIASQPTRLPLPIFGGPLRVSLSSDEWGVLVMTSVPNKNWSANQMSLCVPGEPTPRWTQPMQIPALELYASASAPDLPLCADLNNDGVDEIFSTKLSDKWGSMAQLECLAVDTGRPLWKTSPPIVSISSVIEKCVAIEDIDGDGWKELLVGSLALWPRPHQASDKVRLLIDVISGRDGSRVGYREEALFLGDVSGNAIEIDHFSFDPLTGLASASIVYGNSEELELSSLVLQVDLSGRQETRIARGLTHLSPPTSGLSGGFYRLRPGPFSTQTDSAVWLQPEPSQLWLGGENLSSIFQSRDNRLRFLVRNRQNGHAYCVDADSGETVWQSDVECDGNTKTFPLPCEDGSVDLLTQKSNFVDSVPTLINGETGKVRFSMDEFPFGEILDLKLTVDAPHRFFYALADAESRDSMNRNRTVGAQGYLLMKVDRKEKRILWKRRCYSSMEASRHWELPSRIREVSANEDPVMDVVIGDIQNGEIVIQALDGVSGEVIWTHNLEITAGPNTWPRNMHWPVVETHSESGFVFTLNPTADDPDHISLICFDALSGDRIDQAKVPFVGRSLMNSRNPGLLHVISRDSQSTTLAILTEATGDRGWHTVWTVFEVDSKTKKFRQIHQQHYDRRVTVLVADIDGDKKKERVALLSKTIECREAVSDELVYSRDIDGRWNGAEEVVFVNNVPTLRYRSADDGLAWLDLRDGRRIHLSRRRHDPFITGDLRLPTLASSEKTDANTFPQAANDINGATSVPSNHAEPGVQWSMIGMTNEGFYRELIDKPEKKMESRETAKLARRLRLSDPKTDPRYYRELVIAHPFRRATFGELAWRTIFASGIFLAPLFYLGRILRRRRWSLRYMLLAPAVFLIAVYSYQGLSNILKPHESISSTIFLGAIGGFGLIGCVQLLMHRQWKILINTFGFCVFGAAISFLMLSFAKTSVHEEIHYHLTWSTAGWAFVAAFPLIAPGLVVGYFVYLKKRKAQTASFSSAPAIRAA